MSSQKTSVTSGDGLSESLNPEEKSLIEYLLETKEPVFVVLNEDYHPAATTLSNTMMEIQKSNPDVELIEGRFSTYQRFAQTQDIYGFPAVFLFRSGDLIDAWAGLVNETTLQEKLDQLSN